MNPDQDTLSLGPDELCARIEKLTTDMMDFWKSASGWAPVEAAGLLNKSMLEWQASLSSSLASWVTRTSDGDLILAWANLGALVEGQLKLFLSVYYLDYLADVAAIKDYKKGTIQDPDGCTIEPLRQFFVKSVWGDDFDWNAYIERAQSRRNVIHAFQTKDLGTFDEWRDGLRMHLSFLRSMNARLPYPDAAYEPREF